MENRKREFRELSDETKAKISNSSKKPKSTAHKIHISQAMFDYWKTIPNKPKEDHTTMNDLIGASDDD